jgi:predicted nucleotidyltransferase
MEIIYTTLVGSKMHGLDTPESDEDIRHITLSSLRTVISPFQNNPVKVMDSSGTDVESWELRHFVKHLTQGNPTCYEVIKSPLYVRDHKWADKIRSLMPFAFDGIKIMYAHIGYAEAQLKRYLRPANKDFSHMCEHQGDWDAPISAIREENEYRRIPKAIVAAYRVLAQGRQLLDTGDFKPIIKDYSPELHTQLMAIKVMDAADLSRCEILLHANNIENQIQELKAYFETLPESTKNKKPDIEKIEDILCEIYGVNI